MTGTLATLIVCSWIAKDGTAEFTDNPLRVPPAYEEVAVCAPAGKLEDYERYTHDDFEKPAFEDRSGSTIAPKSDPTPGPETVTPVTKERRRKRHRSPRNPR